MGVDWRFLREELIAYRKKGTGILLEVAKREVWNRLKAHSSEG